jgi:hypothetical protein
MDAGRRMLVLLVELKDGIFLEHIQLGGKEWYRRNVGIGRR